MSPIGKLPFKKPGNISTLLKDARLFISSMSREHGLELTSLEKDALLFSLHDVYGDASVFHLKRLMARNPESVRSLVLILSSFSNYKNPEIQSKAVRVLGKIKDPQSFLSLIKFFTPKNRLPVIIDAAREARQIALEKIMPRFRKGFPAIFSDKEYFKHFQQEVSDLIGNDFRKDLFLIWISLSREKFSLFVNNPSVVRNKDELINHEVLKNYCNLFRLADKEHLLNDIISLSIGSLDIPGKGDHILG